EIHVARQLPDPLGFEELGLIENGRDPEVFLIAPAPMGPVSLVLAKGLTVIADEKQHAALEATGLLEATKDLLDADIQQAQVVGVAFALRPTRGDAILGTVVRVRRVRCI